MFPSAVHQKELLRELDGDLHKLRHLGINDILPVKKDTDPPGNIFGISCWWERNRHDTVVNRDSRSSRTGGYFFIFEKLKRFILHKAGDRV